MKPGRNAPRGPNKFGSSHPRDPQRGLRRTVIFLAVCYVACAGLGTAVLTGTGGFDPDGGGSREARGVGPLLIGEPNSEESPSSPLDEGGDSRKIPEKKTNAPGGSGPNPDSD